jgi:ferredoxin
LLAVFDKTFTLVKLPEQEMVNVKFVLPTGETALLCGEEGETLFSLKQHGYSAELKDLECACQGSLACSTCHVIVDKIHYPMTGEISDEENDMLDLAYGRASTSRLGCQVTLTKQLEGAVFTIPRRIDGRSLGRSR